MRRRRPKRAPGPVVECVECATPVHEESLDDAGKCVGCADTDVEVDLESGMCTECGLWICVCG